MSHSPPKILVVSPDRSLLRFLSRLLGALEYGVETVANPTALQAAVARGLPPIVLVDGSGRDAGLLAACRLLDGHPQRGGCVVLVFCRLSSADAVREALEAGADDVLSFPVVYCELLARLRAAARSLEGLRRAELQQKRDLLTGLPTRTALVADAAWEPAPAGSPPAAACVVVEFDGVARAVEEFGRAAAEELQREVAHWLVPRCGQGPQPAAVAAGRFAVWRLGAHAPQAAAWVEELRAAVSGETFGAAGTPLVCSLSAGVAACDHPARAAEALEQAEDALQLALQSGGDQVVTYDEVLAEDQAWAEQAAPSRLLHDALGLHVMVPCTTTVGAESRAADALAVVRSTADEILPVVDAHRRLVGLVSRGQLAEGARDPQRTVAEVMSRDPLCRDERTPLAELMKAFADSAVPRIVICRGGEPLGLVTSESLAVMTHPATATVDEGRSFSASVHYLCVPERAVK